MRGGNHSHRSLVSAIISTAYEIAGSMTIEEQERLSKHVMEIGKKKVRTIDIPEPILVPAWTKPTPAAVPMEPITVPVKVPVTVGGR